MDFYLNELQQWSDANHMQINEHKTKEIIISNSRNVSVVPLPGIERVENFKFLGVFVSEDLKWNDHISYIVGKANSRLHFLRQLKRAGVPTDDMLAYYIGEIRSVLEYAAPAWHSSLTDELSDKLENIQKRALRIVYGGSKFSDNSYDRFCNEISVAPLVVRRETLTSNFFQKILDRTNCLHHLIPARRDVAHVGRLRNYNPYHIPFARTEKFRNSFIMYCLRTILNN